MVDLEKKKAFYRRRKTREEVAREQWESIRPFAEEHFKQEDRKTVILNIILELLRSLKWLVLFPAPMIWEWIKEEVRRLGK